jgi:GT2 family glycosyltransferase
MTVHAFIVTHNSGVFIEEAISSLLSDGAESVSILDNASVIAERASLRRIAAGTEGVEVFFSDENLGFGRGVNRLLDLASRHLDDDSLLWIVNPDLVVSPGAMLALSQALESWHIVSPIIWTGQGADRRLWYSGGDIDTRRGLTTMSTVGDPPTREREVSFITGAAPMMSAGTWRELGGFREDLFLYWEDAELSLRAVQLGLRMAVVPGANVWHAVGGSGEDSGRSEAYYYYMQRNRLLVCAPHSSRRDLVLGHGARYAARLIRAPLREDSGRLGKLRASLRGIAAGLSLSRASERGLAPGHGAE